MTSELCESTRVFGFTHLKVCVNLKTLLENRHKPSKTLKNPVEQRLKTIENHALKTLDPRTLEGK